MKGCFSTLGIVLLILVAILAILIPFNDSLFTLFESLKSNFIHADKGIGTIGDYIGGIVGTIVAGIGVVLLYKTYSSQRQELNETKAIFQQQQFENNFYEQLKIHRDNLSQIEYEDQKGKMGFVRMKQELETVICQVFRSIKPGEEGQGVKVEEFDKISLSYIIFYFGIDQKNNDFLHEELTTILKKYPALNYPDKIASEIIEVNQRTQGEFKKFNGNNAQAHTENLFKIEGQEANLSNYFIHLYQTFRFVNEHSYLRDKEEDKKFYLKRMRAQLSTYELAIFFANSISPLGAEWEWNNRDKPEQKDKALITNYHILKGLPNGFLAGINHRKYYPGMRFSDSETPYCKTKDFEDLNDEDKRLNPLSLVCGGC